jgi:hypothetical protein
LVKIFIIDIAFLILIILLIMSDYIIFLRDI